MTEQPQLTILGEPIQLEHGGHFFLARGSVLDFVGDAMVNAANEGCVSGFGIDEIVNRSGGPELKEARKGLGGCPTGEARITPSFNHTNTKFIIHAVGPVFRINPIRDKVAPDSPEAREMLQAKIPILQAAYRYAMKLSKEKSFGSVGFCILSAGVFRGELSLCEVILTAIKTLRECSYDGLRSIYLVSYTQEEEEATIACLEKMKNLC